MIDEIFDYEYKVSDVLMPCIYFLFDNGKVVYVGKTEYGLKRILCHISDKKFDNVKIKVFNKELLDAYTVEHAKDYRNALFDFLKLIKTGDSPKAQTA